MNVLHLQVLWTIRKNKRCSKWCYCVYKTYQILHVSFQQLGSVKRRRKEVKEQEQLEETQQKVCVANCYCSKNVKVDFNYCRGRNLKKNTKSEYCCNQQSSFILVFVASQWNKQALCNIYTSLDICSICDLLDGKMWMTFLLLFIHITSCGQFIY